MKSQAFIAAGHCYEDFSPAATDQGRQLHVWGTPITKLANNFDSVTWIPPTSTIFVLPKSIGTVVRNRTHTKKKMPPAL